MRRTLNAFIICMLVFSASNGQNLIDGIAVVVGKEIILRSEIENNVRNYLIQNRINAEEKPEIVAQLREKTVESLIEQKLMLAQAEIDTIEVDPEMLDQRVEERIRYLIERVGSEDQLEKTFQGSMKKIRKDTRKLLGEQLLVEQVRQQRFREVQISKREVEAFYKTYQDSLPQIKETVQISHILKTVSASNDAKSTAYGTITDIKSQLENGGNFEELAKKYSQDPASQKRGGDLGLISRGDFVKEYETVAFSLNDGVISDVVETQFGYHIIKMVERRGEKIHTKHILILVIPDTNDEQRVIDELAALKAKALSGENFNELAIASSDDENVATDKGVLGTFEYDQLVVPQFKEVLSGLNEGEISNPFKTDFGYHIVRLDKRIGSRVVSLADDWQKIEKIAQNFKIEKEYKNWIETLKSKVPISVKERT